MSAISQAVWHLSLLWCSTAHCWSATLVPAVVQRCFIPPAPMLYCVPKHYFKP